MIITVVCDVLGEENNGVVIAEMNLIRYLKSVGHDVRVLCPDETKSGVDGFYVVPTRSFGPFDDYVKRNGVSLARPDETVVRAAVEGADIVHLMLPFTLSKAALKVAKECGIPTTAGVHLMAENFSMHLRMGGIRIANRVVYDHFFDIIGKCDAVHYVTQFLRNLYEGMFGKTNGYVISNGVNDRFRPISEPDTSDGIYRIIYTGRLAREKNQKELIDAVSRSKYRDKIKITFAGSGPLSEYLHKRVARRKVNAEFRFFSRDELVEKLNESYLYVHAATVEAEGIGCLEAIACGTVPIMCNSPKSATKDYALCPESLFAPGKPKDLAAKIDWWIEHPEKRAEWSKKYAALAVDDFGQTQCMDKMERMFVETVERFGKKSAAIAKEKTEEK